jgi:predicted ferric reductase
MRQHPGQHEMPALGSAVLWILIYLLLVAAPLVLLLIGPMPAGGGFWWDFSMALGFAGMAMMGVQFALTARFRRAAAPFGIDIIYYFHRFAAIIAFALVAAHFLIIRIDNPQALGTMNPLEAPWYMSAGRLALLLFGIIIVTSLWRKPLRIEYDSWRIAHALLATAAFVAAVGHISGVGYYTAAPWKSALWTAYTLFWVLLILHVRLAKPWAMRRRPWRVVEVRPERGSAWTLALEPEGHAGLRFAPGQFAWLTLRASPYHVKEHPFSMSSSAGGARLEFTIKELGDFTRTIHTVKPGEIAYLDGPYGVFTTERYPRSRGFVFIAGGVGIAPIISMLRTAAERRESRPLTLVYANDRWEDVIFREELERLRELLDLRLVHVLAEPPENWRGEQGYVDRALLDRHLPPERHGLEYFICGPRPMTDAAQQALRELGVPLGRVHFELFEMV